MRNEFQKPLALIGLFYCSAIWGSTFFVVKDALVGIDPIVMVGYRFLLGALILCIYLVWKKEPLFTDMKQSLILGSVLMLLYIPQTIGLGLTSASNSAFITGLFVAWAPLLSFFFKRKPGWVEWLGVVVSLIGLWFLTGGLGKVNIGDMITLFAAFSYALHVLLTDKIAEPGCNPYRISFQQFLVIGVFSLAIAGGLQLPFSIQSTTVFWAVAFLAVFPTATGFVIQLFAQQVISPVQTSLIFALEPVFGAVFAWTIGGEATTTHALLGGGLIVLAIMLNSFVSPSKSLSPAS